jgi:hypothetical protein
MPSPLLGTDITIALLSPLTARGLLGMAATGAARLLRTTSSVSILAPSNGNSYGSCPGYVIDQINPLECGGADAPFNMQWQTIADGKAKDKTERNCRL